MHAQLTRVTKQTWQSILLDYAQITLGSVLLALAYNLFYIPNEVVSGGLSGIGVITHHLLGWPVGVVTLVLNVPLFLAGLRWGGGLTTGVRTLYAIAVMSLAIDGLAPHLPSITRSPLLFIAYGGMLDGVGVGLVLRAQGTTGGTDIIGRLLRRFTGLEISRGVFIANAIIVGAAAIVFGMEQALYGVMAAAISSVAIDFVLAGGRRARQAVIISEQWTSVRDAILSDMERGVTILPAQGAYTGSDRPILLCVVSPTEIAQIRRLVMSFDPRAFVVITATSEVWGEGFAPIQREV
jgi:uncharacterized membrane-anchored protein YitT (DUF2179 family)